ncbi:hypothetical protein SLE2022_184980 [Rubroshorea leprosula]
MEVLVGPTFVDVPPGYVREASEDGSSAGSPCLFIKEDADVGAGAGGGEIRKGIGSGLLDDTPEGSSETESSSSIGGPGDSDGEEEDGVVSSQGSGGLASLDSLEDSLPIKRGLSNHYSGKSKSFANIADVSLNLNTAKDLEKPESPFNKRRRVLIANKWARKSFYSWQNPKSMPVLASLNEDDEDEEGKEIPSSSSSSSSSSCSSSSRERVEETARTEVQKSKLKHTFTFKSQSCFSLTDLQEQEQEQDQDQ